MPDLQERYRPRRSIQRQLIAGLAAILIPLMAVFVFDVVARQQAFLSERANTRALDSAEALALSTGSTLARQDLDDLRAVIQAVGASQGMLYVAVVDAGGGIIAQSDMPLPVHYLQAFSESTRQASALAPRLISRSPEQVAAAAPVTQDGATLAWVIVVKDLGPEGQYVAAIQRRGLIYVILAVLLGTLFAMVLARLMTRPLRKLFEGAQLFGRGVLDRPVPITTQNEIGVVTQAFNEAVATVNQQRAELQERSEFLKFLTDSLPVLIAYVDSEERYQFNNRAYEEWFQIDRNALKGVTLKEFLGEEAYGAVAPNIHQALQGHPVSFEGLLPYRHGDARFINAVYVPHFVEGKVVGYFALIVDITERKRAEVRLRESEARFKLLADSAPVLIWMSDASDSGIYFNRTWLEFTGRSLEEEAGDGWMEGVHPDDRQTSLRTSADAHAARLPFTVQFRMMRHDGEYRWLLDTGMPRFDDQGGFLGYIGSMVDVTDQRRVEAELREWKNRYEAAVRASAQLLYDWDPNTNELEWAGEMERILGYRIEEFGRDLDAWVEIIHPEDRGPFREDLRRMQVEAGAARMQYRIRRKDGRYIHVEDRGDFTLDAQGRPHRMIGFVEDISARKHAELTLQGMAETLEQRVEERTAEANQRATELRLMAMELTQTEQRERRKLAQVLHDDLQQLVAVAKLRLGRIKEMSAATEFQQVLHETDELLSQVIQTARTLSVELSPPVLQDRGLPAALEWLARKFEQEQGLRVYVTAEAGASTNIVDTDLFLLQAVRELLFNICKHAGTEDAHIRVTTRDREILLELWDEGRGFNVEEMEVRASAEHFGLFSIRQRVSFLGGKFIIQSTLGQGTHIEITLPVSATTPVPEAAPRRTPTPSPAHYPSAPARKIRVLLVDDHQIVRQGLSGLLGSLGDMEVVAEAGDGLAAIEACRNVAPDVVIMDVSMPVKNGIEATRVIHEEQPDVRIIGLSMHEAQDMAAAMLDAGAVAYLPKDGPASMLVQAIRGEAAS